jgi:SAM-dependent methyltransferase
MKNKVELKRVISHTLLNKHYIIDSHLRASLTDAVEQHAKGRALDLGCGLKPYKRLLETRADKYLSLEYAGAKDYFGTSIKDVDVYGDCQDLPFKSGTIDTVLCVEVIEHVPEPFKLVQESSRILREGGILILAAPSTFQIHMEPHDYFRFTKYGLQYLIRKAGLRVLSIRSWGRAVATVGQLLSTYLNEALIADPKTKQPRLGRAAVVLPACALLQGVVLALDHFTRSESLTLGYTVVCQK